MPPKTEDTRKAPEHIANNDTGLEDFDTHMSLQARRQQDTIAEDQTIPPENVAQHNLTPIENGDVKPKAPTLNLGMEDNVSAMAMASSTANIKPDVATETRLDESQSENTDIQKQPKITAGLAATVSGLGETAAQAALQGKDAPAPVTKRGSVTPVSGSDITPQDLGEILSDQKLLDVRQANEAHHTDASDLPRASLIEAAAGNGASARSVDTSVFTLSAAAPLSGSLSITSSNPALTTVPNVNIPISAPSLTSVMKSVVQTLETQKGVTVRLDPPEMGRVYIDYQFDADRNVTALVRADLPEALAQLRDNASLLQSFLKDHGFDNVNLSFEQNNPDQHSSEKDDFQGRIIHMDEEISDGLLINSQAIAASLTPLNTFQNLSIDIKL